MQKNGNVNTETLNENLDNTTIVQTDIGVKNGQYKCPKCGATDISLNTKNGHLKCNFCKYEFEVEKVVGFITDIHALQGEWIGSGAQDIQADVQDVLTLKCSSCGAEVVIDTSSSMQARCHWCRNVLSVNEQIPNGSVPDVVLPFQITKEEAKVYIEKFVHKRRFFAHPKFKAEFMTDNVMGVYFPYMVVDIHAHAKFVGQGEHLVRQYTRGDEESKRVYYDADLFDVEREFDIAIKGLTIESNLDRLNIQHSYKTNNIINSIMPFDIENCVKYNANYLKGYTSEKRDVNVEQLKSLVELQSKDVARFSANKTLTNYDRGVAWSKQDFDVKGQQWKAAYLPVWLYSYQQVKGKRKILHYVAVNARTKETMGSIPIHMPKLIAVSLFIEMLSVFFLFFVDIGDDFGPAFILFLPGLIYFAVMLTRYRNPRARHMHETETESQMFQLRKVDQFVKRKKGLSNSKIVGMNHTSVSSRNVGNQVLSSIECDHAIADFITNTINEKEKL